MVLIKPIQPHGPISKKILASMEMFLSQKILDFSELKEAKINAENLEKQTNLDEDLTQYDPLHLFYMYGLNKLGVLLSQISQLPAVRKLTQALDESEDIYMPEGPPISPLTCSYFTFWSYFDLSFGPKKETFGTIAIDLCKALGSHSGLIEIFETMQNSRMGIYVNEGRLGKFIFLRELITQKKIKAISPAGYMGKSDELWYVRIMPEPLGMKRFGYSLIINTPYILGEWKRNTYRPSKEEKWLEYFDKNLSKTAISDKTTAYEYLMKYGLERHYWNEFIFEGYLNHSDIMVSLAGYPDIPSSRPHSRVNRF